MNTFTHVFPDMKYVIIERNAHYSANIINYGPWIVNIRMKTVGKRDHLGKRGIVVQLMKNTNVSVGDYAVLQVTWYPTQEKFSEKATNVKHTIYIEVRFRLEFDDKLNDKK